MDIFADYAGRLGLTDRDGAPLVSWRTPEECFEAFKQATRGRPCDYSGLSYPKLRGAGGIQWPVTQENPAGTERLYADHRFNAQTDYCEDYGHDLLTGAVFERKDHAVLDPAGRAVLKAADCFPPHEAPDEDYPLLFTNGRTVYHFHTRTKTAHARQLAAAAPEVWVELSPEDAGRLGIGEGDLVKVESRRGHLEGRARICGIRPGTVFAPFHYGYWDLGQADAQDDAGPATHPRAANELTVTEWDPVSKQPLFKAAAVRVSKLADAGSAPSQAPTTAASAPLQPGVPATAEGDGACEAVREQP
jgi:anaerobic selenocysteine-containing dehydrogenase